MWESWITSQKRLMHDFDKFSLHPNPPPDDNDEVVDPENLALDLEHLAIDNVLNSNPE